MRMTLFLILGLTVGCATSRGYVDGDQAPEVIKKKVRLVRTLSECKDKSGIWRGVKKSPLFPSGGYCQFKTIDSGKVCNSSRECQGYCELSFDEAQGQGKPKCSSFVPPQWDRCVPGYFEKGKILGRGECFGEDSEVQ